MALLSILHISPLYAILGVIAICLAIVVLKSRAAGLEHVPGPFLSRYTDAYRAYLAYKHPHREENIYMILHRKYGDVVRVGPRSVSVLDPKAIPTIYGVKNRLDKSPNVEPFNVPGVPKSILGMVGEEEHSRNRKPIQHAYSLTSLKGFEPYVNDTISMLVGEMTRYAEQGKPINLSQWLYYWSYDTIGKLTYGEPSGYLKSGSDFNNFIKRQMQFFDYVNIASQMPAIDRLLKTKLMTTLFPRGTFDFVDFARMRVKERISEYVATDEARPDLLSHFIQLRETFPEVVDEEQVVVYSLTNVIAGSLSSSHVLDEIALFLVANPQAQKRAAEEVRSVDPDLTASFDLVRKLPFLEGIIYEGFRIHNIANATSERTTSAAGMKLPSGHFLPAGTNVGINAAAMNRRTEIFGPNTYDFVPTRWLRQDGETEEEFVERRARMDRATLTFGQGSRTCLGKNIVQLELFKLMAAILSRFQFDGVGNPDVFKVYANVTFRKFD